MTTVLAAIAQFSWIVVAAILITLAAVFAPEIQVGDLVLRRTDPKAFSLFAVTGVLGAALLLGAVLLVRGNRFGLLLCQWWGTIYGFTMLLLAYANFALLDSVSILTMGVFAAVWYFGVRRSANKVAAGQR